MTHAIGRFFLHLISSGTILLVTFYLMLKLVNHDPWLGALVSSAFIAFACIAPREAFDVSKLSRRRKAAIESTLDFFSPSELSGKPGLEQQLMDARHDPRYTIWKSIFDFASWILGLGVSAWLLYSVR